MPNKKPVLPPRNKNNLVSVRLNGEAELALKNGLKQTGLTRASYLRMAVIEKAERDKKCK